MSVAIVGTGWGVRVQVPAFRSAGLAVVALAGSDAAKTQRIAAEHKVGFATGDWRALLERDDVALVSLTTPPDTHAEMAQAILGAGKHVLCEKPTALNAAQAEQMLAAALAHPAQLALIDHELRFLPSLIHAREMVTSGAIGVVQRVAGMFFNTSRADPQRPWTWWNDAARGGGMLGALCSHQMDCVRYVLGAEITRVAATLYTTLTERPDGDTFKPVTSDDGYSVRLELSNGAYASLEGHARAQIDEPNQFTCYGEAGTLRWSNGTLWHAAPGAAFEDITPTHRYPMPAELSGAFPQGTVYIAHALRAYLDGDRAALAPGATFADGVAIQCALDAARQSHQHGGGFIALPT